MKTTYLMRYNEPTDSHRRGAEFIPIRLRLPGLLAGFLACQAVASPASQSAQNTLPAKGETSQQELTDQNEDTAQKQNLVTSQINSLLVDKEIPLIGGRWGGDLFVDIPLNREPDDASVTLRRAKLKYSRTLTKNWQLKLSAAYYTNAGLEIDDSYFVYKGWSRALVTIGVTDPPFSLESASSAAGQTFMERGLAVVALSEQKGGGFTFLKRTPSSILNAAVTFFTPHQDNKREAGQALILHYIYSPVGLRGRDNIHLGGSFSYRVNTDSDNTRFRSRPEIATTQQHFVDTGAVDGANTIVRASLEASRVNGRLSWQTELLSTQVKRDGFDSVFFWGAYAYVSWFLTDDSRNYNSGTGLYDPLTPKSPLFKGGRGAFELAFRASYVDLTDKDIIGGEESNLSLGFNWYLNYKLRLMTNVIKVLDVKRPGSEYDGQSPLIFAIRAQWLMK
jgi:phosphate-selective porin OprO/OprP